MQVTLLAITQIMDEFSIAGMSEEGEWIRPVPGYGNRRLWTKAELTDSDGDFVRQGDIWSLKGKRPRRPTLPSGTEDFEITRRMRVGTLTHDELVHMLQRCAETEMAFVDTLYARKRSLCLIEATDPVIFFSESGGRKVVRMKLEGSNYSVANPFAINQDYVVKDFRWGLLKRGDVSLDQIQMAYAVIGLSSPVNGVEYPQIFGLYMEPLVKWPNSLDNDIS